MPILLLSCNDLSPTQVAQEAWVEQHWLESFQKWHEYATIKANIARRSEHDSQLKVGAVLAHWRLKRMQAREQARAVRSFLRQREAVLNEGVCEAWAYLWRNAKRVPPLTLTLTLTEEGAAPNPNPNPNRRGCRP